MSASPVLIPLHARGGAVVAYAIVDAADAEWLSRSPWHLNDKGYAKRGPGTIYMHRAVLGLTPGDGLDGDHINRNRLDNRRANLRVGTRADNGQNRSPNARGSSRFRGVSWNRKDQKWRAYVRVDGRLRFLGNFDDEEQAGRVAASARREALPLSVEAA